MMEASSVVYVIDDDEKVRTSLESLFRSVSQVVQTFRSTKEFSQFERLHEGPACIVLDVRLPGQSGLEFQRELSLAGRSPPIVFITGHGDIAMSVAAMKAGAVEFITKPFRHQDLLDAVHRALAIDEAQRANVAEMQELRERFLTLTQREREIISAVAAGRLNKQIAGDLGLSEITVKVHRSHVMQKMQASSLPDLVRIWDKLAAQSDTSSLA